MFPITRCSVPACARLATWDRPTCAEHDPDPEALHTSVLGYLSATRHLSGLSLAGLTLRDLDLSERTIDFCNFSRSILERVSFVRSKLRYVYLDLASIEACDFRGVDIAMCVFAGACMRDCNFTGSEIIQTNFVGATCEAVRFADSDLYSSRFISARLRDVDMRNCNLKEVHFDRPPGLSSGQSAAEAAGGLGIDVRSSNSREAVYGGER